MKKPSRQLIRALSILVHHGDISARQFAERMWPDSPGWSRVINTGPNGATHGKGMWLAAGSYLAKLRDRGLVRAWIDDYGHRHFWITDKGLEIMRGERR